ncbi:MAG TPA: PhzF family phenazine biosynthesis protein [Thermoanaerobaculia bacterium]|jgi:PhzF family phenazine biosynthesis protein
MKLLQIDAFTSEPFRGNPAAVCLLDRERESPWMQDVAAEMNLSETAFVLPIADGFSLRWFTPSAEVALCGHATLATAHALWEEQLLGATDIARFHTQSGILTAERRDDRIELDFPATPEEQSDAPEGMLDALGVTTAVYVGRNKFDLLVEVESEEIVRALAPDHARLRTIPVRGVVVTSRPATSEFDFVSRFFAPGVGVDEDPVTGSAHCCLTPYWSARLGKSEMLGYQASKRGGVVHVRLERDRVKLGGRAVTIFRGDLLA